MLREIAGKAYLILKQGCLATLRQLWRKIRRKFMIYSFRYHDTNTSERADQG